MTALETPVIDEYSSWYLEDIHAGKLPQHRFRDAAFRRPTWDQHIKFENWDTVILRERLSSSHYDHAPAATMIAQTVELEPTLLQDPRTRPLSCRPWSKMSFLQSLRNRNLLEECTCRANSLTVAAAGLRYASLSKVPSARATECVPVYVQICFARGLRSGCLGSYALLSAGSSERSSVTVRFNWLRPLLWYFPTSPLVHATV